MDYDDMLERALDQTPDVDGSSERFDVPEPEVSVEGNSTVYRNFGETAQYLNRDVDAVFKYFKNSLATSGSIEENERALFKGEFRKRRFEETLDEYVSEYVLCGECGSPDTYLKEKNGATVRRCEACGAISPAGR